MPLKLMYITNNPDVARIAEEAGVDRMFVDMEYIGKADRQGGMDTVQSKHSLQDVKIISETIKKAELLVRINPIHEVCEAYGSSEEEIDAAIENGADILMLPYFKTPEEVRLFVEYVDGRAKTMPLVETPEAVAAIDEILEIDGIDEMFIGLNDLSLGYGKKFMFELLADGTVDYLAEKFNRKGIPFGFGGLASLDGGLVPGRMVLQEHYRLGSGCVILSRSFCNASRVQDISKVEFLFKKGIADIRKYESICWEDQDFSSNRTKIVDVINGVVETFE